MHKEDIEVIPVNDPHKHTRKERRYHNTVMRGSSRVQVGGLERGRGAEEQREEGERCNRRRGAERERGRGRGRGREGLSDRVCRLESI